MHCLSAPPGQQPCCHTNATSQSLFKHGQIARDKCLRVQCRCLVSQGHGTVIPVATQASLPVVCLNLPENALKQTLQAMRGQPTSIAEIDGNFRSRGLKGSSPLSLTDMPWSVNLFETMFEKSFREDEQHKHKQAFRSEFSAEIPDPHARMPRGQKVSPHHWWGRRTTHFCCRRSLVRTSMTRSVLEELRPEKVALIFWSLIISLRLSSES